MIVIKHACKVARINQVAQLVELILPTLDIMV